MKHARLNSRVAIIASGILIASSAFAQSAAEQGPPLPETSAATAAPAQIEDQKVDQFAAAFVAVQDIQAQAAQQLSNTADEQQATQVKAKAEQQMIAAVEREGLQVEEFNRIADLLNTDLALRSKVVEKVEKRRKG